jgi:hypothetical protein
VIAQHSSKTNEHYGPRWLTDGAHELMGGIDLDPASCEEANKIVRATTFYALPQDGRRLPYFGKVYNNPPGGSCEWPGPLPRNRKRDHSSPALWWAILAHWWERGIVDQAIFVIFNLETLRYATGYPVLHPLDFPVLIPYERIDFLDANGEEQGSPAHSNMIVWLPPTQKFGPTVNGETSGHGRHKIGDLAESSWCPEFEKVFGGRGKIFGPT